MLSKYLLVSRTSSDQGCAPSPWAGTKDQGHFRGPISVRAGVSGPEPLLPGEKNRTATSHISPKRRSQGCILSHFKSVCAGNQNLKKMTSEVVHALQPSTTAGNCQRDFDCCGLCDRELICANQTISSRATEVLIRNLSWLLQI